MDAHHQSDSCCKKQKLVTDSSTGETACGSCGHVFGTEEPSELGTKLFKEEELKDLQQNAPFYSLSSKSNTVIGDKDYSGKPLSGQMSQTFGRLRMWDSRSYKGKKKRRLADSTSKIHSVMKDSLGASDDRILEAQTLFKKSMDAGLTRGRLLGESMAGAVYAVLNKYGSGRISEVADEFGTTKKKVTRAYNIISEKFWEEINNGRGKDQRYQTAKTSVRQELHVSFKRAMENLKMPPDVGRKVESYVGNLFSIPEMEKYFAGKKRDSLIAAAIYMAILANPYPDHYYNQDEVAKAAGVTSVTIRNRYKEMAEILKKSSGAKTF